MDGFQLIEKMKKESINTPVIFLNDKEKEEDEIKGLELGAVEYINKPISKEILLLRIKNLLKNLNIKD